MAKRGIDVVVSLLGLAISAPLLLVISVAVGRSMGRPVLFRQERLGYLGRPFSLRKFRTMLDAHDERGNPLPDESRLTRSGRFLRRTSLDELPGLINVLQGDMSMVGPRPLLPEYRDRYTAEQWRRHEMPPGIAGPVQAYGRNALDWDQKLALDVWYVNNWSLRVDLKLLVLSLRTAVTGRGVSAEGHATMPPFEGSPDPRGERP
jgi:lipopolysaccharide/colanic/teichoic acid biosynthesis glycosyltransferase